MLFADVPLAARIDRAEASLCAALAAGQPGGAAADDGVLVVPVSGGLAVCGKPGFPCNKVVGLGFEDEVEERSLDDIEEMWRARGEPVRVELSTLARPEVGTTLTRRGYRLLGFEHVLGLLLSAQDTDARSRASLARVPGLTIEAAGPEHRATWIDVAVTGFLHMDGSGAAIDETFQREALHDVVSAAVSAGGVDRFLARIDGEAAAAASLRIEGGIAQLCGAATLPQFRRRGIQTALLTARLRHAGHAGCELAVVTTAPGSKSQTNAQRQGFEPLYARAVLVKSWE